MLYSIYVYAYNCTGTGNYGRNYASRNYVLLYARTLILARYLDLSYGEVWARRNVYSAPHGYYKCTDTHGTPRGTRGGPRIVVQQIPMGGYNTQGGVWHSRAYYLCTHAVASAVPCEYLEALLIAA